MFALPTNRSCLFHASILLVGLGLALQCHAQQSEGSLFVIKSEQLPSTTLNKPAVYNEPARPFLSAIQVSGQGESPLQDLDDSKLEEPVVDPLMEKIKKLGEPLPEDKDEPPLKDDVEDRDEPEDENTEDETDDLIVEEAEDDVVEPTLTTWNQKPMSQIFPGIRPVSGKAPADQSWQLTSRVSVPTAKTQKLFAWAAPDIGYNPLYFEDVALERYGQTRGLWRQPLVSGFHFLKSAAFLPYYSLFDPVDSCDGPLGYCRPGTTVNCTLQKHYFGNPFRCCR